MSSTISGRPSVPPKGIYTPLVTFFNADSTIDFEAIEQHALRIASGGVSGLVLQGSNGEAVHLSSDERQSIIRAVRSVLNSNGYKHLPLLVGVGAPSEMQTVRLAKEAKTAGGDFALVLPPSYWPTAMTKQVILKFFIAIADQSPLPIVVYNFPLVANGVNIDSDLMLELAVHRNIVGCKLTCGNLGNLHRIASHTSPDAFATMSGKAEFALHGFVGGASGCIAALVNLAPKTHVALYYAFQSAHMERARELQTILADADQAQSKLGVAGLKLATSHYFGYGSGLARSPLPNGDVQSFQEQRKALDALIDLERSL